MPSLPVNTSVSVSLPAGSSINITGNGAWAFIATVSGREIASGSYVGPDVIGPFTRAAVVGLTATVSDGLQYTVADFVEGNSAAAALTTEDVTAIKAQVSGDWIKGKLRAAASAGIFPASLTAPTFTKATSSGMTGVDYIDRLDSSIRLLGAKWQQVGANPRSRPVSIDYNADGSDVFAASADIVFCSDAQVFELIGMYDYYAIYVDLLDGQGWRYAGTNSSGNTGTLYYLKVDFSSVYSGAKPARYRVKCGGSTQFYAINCPKTSRLWRYEESNLITAALIGDSFGEGAGATNPGIEGYAQRLSVSLGLTDFRINASGSTGMVEPASGRVNYQGRLPEVISWAPKLVIIQGSQNDNDYTPAQVTAAFNTLVSQLRAALPSVELRYISVWKTIQNPAEAIANRAALNAAAEAAGVIVWDWSGFVTGTGKVGTTTGDGNSDVVTSSDGTHPSTYGHQYFERRLLSVIAAAEA